MTSLKLPLRAYNLCAPFLSLHSPLNVDTLLEEASRHYGLTDFGSDSFMEPLGVLIGAINNSETLSPFGLWHVRSRIRTALRNRLYIEARWKKYPQLADKHIRRPIILTGLPRSGSTHLSNLITRNPKLTYVANWEAFCPAAPPGDGPDENKRSRVRIRKKQALRLSAFKYLTPRMKAIHEIRLEGPEDCWPLAINEFTSRQFDANYGLEEYRKWMKEYKHMDVIEYLSKQIKILSAERKSDWWFIKSLTLPSTMAFLEYFEDPCIVQVHRDLAKVIPSLCSIMAVVQKNYNTRICPDKIGAAAMDTTDFRLKTNYRLRSGYKGHNIYDIYYGDLIKDPLGTIEGMYDHFGLELTEETVSAMTREIAASPQGKHGAHSYDLTEYGLSEEIINRKFGWYMDAFKIPKEEK